MKVGIFINKEEHPNLYKTNQPMHTTNQTTFRLDAWTEWLKEQKRANEELNQVFQELKGLYNQSEQKNTVQWQTVGKELQALHEVNDQREAFEKYALQLLTKLEEKQSELEEKGEEDQKSLQQEIRLFQVSMEDILRKLTELMKDSTEKINTNIHNLSQQRKEIHEEIQLQREKQDDMQRKLGDHGETMQRMHQAFEERFTKIVKQLDRHEQYVQKSSKSEQQILEKLQQQETQLENVIERIEKQEGLSEKIIREIQHIRSILFERASFLANKIENGYKLTSSYFSHILWKKEDVPTGKSDE